MKERGRIDCVDWAVALRPLPGQPVSGDLYVVEAFPEGVLLGVIDGLGHGVEAARVARLAAASLKRSQPGRGLEATLRECHAALRGTRGAVMTLAFYRPESGRLEWSSIGNVEAILWHCPGEPEGQRLSVSPRGGVLGYQIPNPHVTTVAVAAGDVLCLATDGITSEFAEKTPAFLEPRALADFILERYGREEDDALVLVARLGRGGP